MIERLTAEPDVYTGELEKAPVQIYKVRFIN